MEDSPSKQTKSKYGKRHDRLNKKRKKIDQKIRDDVDSEYTQLSDRQWDKTMKKRTKVAKKEIDTFYRKKHGKSYDRMQKETKLNKEKSPTKMNRYDKDMMDYRKQIAGDKEMIHDIDLKKKKSMAKMSADLKYMPVVDREKSTMSASGAHKVLKHMKGRM